MEIACTPTTGPKEIIFGCILFFSEKVTLQNRESDSVSFFRLLPLWIFLGLPLGFAGPNIEPAEASPASLVLDDVVLDNRDGRVKLGCGVRVEDETSIREALADGMDLEMVCTGTLSRVRTAMWDETLGVQRFKAELKGDLLNRQVILSQEGRRKVFSETALAEELNRAWARLNFDLGPWSLIDRQERYVVRINVTLKKTEIPAWVRVPLFFWSWDVVPEADYRMEIGHRF